MRRAWMGWLVALGALAPVSAVAQTTPGWSAGPEAFYYAYREPNFVEQRGPALGGNVGYTFKLDNWFVSLDGEAAVAYLDYKSSGTGTLNGLWNLKGEFRTLVGGDIGYSGSFFISPFTGLGYRVLFEAGSGRTTSTGAVGYDRLSQYFYIPLGIAASFVAGDWILRPSAEYDLFLGGVQISYLSQAGANNDVTNRQGEGYGARASFLMETGLSRGRIAFGPFFRYWNIGDSRSAPLNLGGVAFIATEPHNNTVEAGMTVRFLF